MNKLKLMHGTIDNLNKKNRIAAEIVTRIRNFDMLSEKVEPSLTHIYKTAEARASGSPKQKP